MHAGDAWRPPITEPSRTQIMAPTAIGSLSRNDMGNLYIIYRYEDLGFNHLLYGSH